MASDVNIALDEDNPAAVELIATDVDQGDVLSYIVVSEPVNGTLTGTGSSLRYTPNPNYFGADSFTYKANDGRADSNVSTVSITVNSVNDAPVSQPVAVSVAEDGQVTVNLVASDIEDDTLTYSIVSGPSKGTLTGTGASRVYTPNLNYFGADSFTYKVNDGRADSNVSTVSITVNPVNDAPVTKFQKLHYICLLYTSPSPRDS